MTEISLILCNLSLDPVVYNIIRLCYSNSKALNCMKKQLSYMNVTELTESEGPVDKITINNAPFNNENFK